MIVRNVKEALLVAQEDRNCSSRSTALISIVVVLCFVCIFGVYVIVDVSVYGVVCVVEIVEVVGFFVVEYGVFVVWHGTVTFLQHLNLTS